MFRRNLLEVGLVALGDDVEGVADLEVQRFVLRRVADAILADELHAALRVGLVDAHRARRHRHPQSGLLLVLELVIHLHDVLDRRSRVLRVAVVEVLAFDDVALADGNAGAAEQAHLLGLVVVDGRAAIQACRGGTRRMPPAPSAPPPPAWARAARSIAILPSS